MTQKDFIIDYCGYILLKVSGPVLRSLPKTFGLFIGRTLGRLFYYLDPGHRALAYANIRSAFGGRLLPSEIASITRGFYQAFGQNIIEILFIPAINKKYIDKYISIDGLAHIREGFKKGKGVILLSVHAGSWELSNIICANLGFDYNLFVRQQKYPRLSKFLNSYRSYQGCKLINREDEIRGLIKALKENQAVGMSMDQGGRDGVLVKFFGREASLAGGAVRIALKYDAAIIPVFSLRLRGPYLKFFIAPVFTLKRSGDLENDIKGNLEELAHIFEEFILKYPHQYLWTYKIWKHGKERNILVLSDGKAGHLRQSQGLVKLIRKHFQKKLIRTNIDVVELAYRNSWARLLITLSVALAGKYSCQGCLWCLKTFLKKNIFNLLSGLRPDIIVSCGSSLAAVNFVLCRETLAKSMVIMRPSVFSTNRFDLVVMPRHDHPPSRKNIVSVAGALNSIDEEELKKQAADLLPISNFYIGLLIGGDTKNFHLDREEVSAVIKEIKLVSAKLNADVLVTTSRRTPKDIDDLIKEEFKDYSRCKLLVIANEKNIPEAVGGILGLSQIVITSAESISMISEAVGSKKYVVVFASAGLGRKHRRFLNHFAKNKYIYMTESSQLSQKIEEIWLNKPQIYTLKDNLLLQEALAKIL